MQAGYVAKKAARGSRRLCPVPSERRGPLRFTRFSKFRIPRNPRTADRSVRRGISYDPSLGNQLSPKRSLDEEEEWIESTEEKLFTINRENFLVQKQRTTSMQKLIGNNINSFITQASIHSGANDGVTYLG